MDIYQFAQNLLNSNPDKANSPLGQQLQELLKSRDSAKGEQLANNILSTYGVSKEEAMKKKGILGI